MMSSVIRLPGRFGDYTLLALLGEGGMAEVFRAVREGPMGFRKELAIKRIRTDLTRDNETLIKSLINEARLGGQLRHPHIVDTYEFGEVAGQHYIAMEFVNGLTLASLIRGAQARGRQLPLGVVVDVGMQVAEGLAYAHGLTLPDGQSLHLVHRDLKPANIIVSKDGVAKVMDFGIARTAAAMYRTTTADMAKGTLNYMSPEQFGDHAELDHRSDLFALGTILFEMLTGKLLTTAPTMEQVFRSIVTGAYRKRLTELDAVSPELKPIVARCLALEREERYPDAGALVHALQDARDELEDDQGCKQLMALIGAMQEGDSAAFERLAVQVRRRADRSGGGTGWGSLLDAIPGPVTEEPDPFRTGLHADLSSMSIETRLPDLPRSDPGQQTSVKWRAADVTDATLAEPLPPTTAHTRRRTRPLTFVLAAVIVSLLACCIGLPMLLAYLDEPAPDSRSPEADERAVEDGVAVVTGPREAPVSTREPQPAPPTSPSTDDPRELELEESVDQQPVEEVPAAEEPEAEVRTEEPRETREAPVEESGDPEEVAEAAKVPLVVNSTPGWSSWKVSGPIDKQGQTPFRESVPPGTYRFVLTDDTTGKQHRFSVAVEGDEPRVSRLWNFETDSWQSR